MSTLMPSSVEHSEGQREVEIDGLYKAICGNNWNGAKAILDRNPWALTAKITPSGKTALHVAAWFGHVSIVKELVELVSSDELKTVDDWGNTSLSLAAVTGITQVAKCLVTKNRDILGIPNNSAEIPVTLALIGGHDQEMGRYLYSVTPLEYLTPQNGQHGAKLLYRCLQIQCLDIVVDLLERCEELLFGSKDYYEWKPMYGIATMNSSFPSLSELGFWKRFIYQYINTPSTTAINHVGAQIQQEDKSERAQAKLTKQVDALLKWLISSTYNFIGIKKIQELKLLHAQADGILRLVCKNAKKIEQVHVFVDALSLAAKEGNVEFVFQVIKANPEILLIPDRSAQNIFSHALSHRQAGVFNLIHGLRFKDAIATGTDINGNTLLHVAAMLAPAIVLNSIYGPALQMQKELQWFKEVESLIPPTIRAARNNFGLTAEELFRQSHKGLMDQGEKWIKDTASSCSLVGTLIVTIVFTAAFTVPGGNDQSFGYPLLIKQPFFKVFIFSTILSLIFSSISVLMFLAIITSRYSEEKFLKSLPLKLIFGLFSLFISIVTMIIAFLSTIGLMLKHTNYTFGLLPIIILASVPIVLYVFSQFPLLLHSTFSTYQGIFDRKVEPWP